jgi:hypothetical protein
MRRLLLPPLVSLAPSSPTSRPSPSGGLRPALTPAADRAGHQASGPATKEDQQSKISLTESLRFRGIADGRIHSEAAFAALAGVAPLPASSGNTRRHRLNRGGDRRLNRALYTIALTRLGHDPRTRAYRARRIAEGATQREIIRILKRYISRELFRLLTATQPRPSTT